jgi:pSer/pThr/pTyr-binding forkhead associated (FHA) protein
MLVRRFPFRVGRAAGSDLQLEDDGIWDEHLVLEFPGAEKFVMRTAPGAMAVINHQPLQTATLRNGDLLGLGSVKLQFWLAATRQRGLRLREALVWALLAAVTLVQLGLIYRLNR